MPNHISNRISFKALDTEAEGSWKQKEDTFEAVRTLMKTEDRPFDFNVLIPYPEPFKSLDESRRELEKKEGLFAAMSVKDGYNSGGYEWCNVNWGTKWNAYDIGFDYEAILFQTAWSAPRPIFAELSKRFPGLYLEVEYADEDRGSNCGKLTYLNGELIAFTDMSKRPEAALFARAIIAEQSAADNWTQFVELRDKVKAAEAAVSAEKKDAE